MQRLETENDMKVAVAQLAAMEPRFAAIVERHGMPPLRHAVPGLESLLRIVTGQLISLKAGEAIWSRLATCLGGCTPQEVLKVSEPELRALGLSAAKARTFRAAAAVFAQGRFDNALTIGEEGLRRRLLDIPGVGPWTANVYLLMAVRAADAWPAADLALQVAAQDLFGMVDRPSTRQMVKLGAPWRPNRSTAALLLWQHYRVLRGRPIA
ncbi:MAG: DNA-3-methyladenine glycosylase 2 family protein [Aestuariivirga sp.]|uniref:DNA-3-methyladenine glycosylase family protein n=1 Tax=Aestuariivirga sp. TaxID=2650926 RepID=UPI0025BD04E0|nr:DNA-3-methyladenine glycosylase 2 family protein [Aestuariivirga sp.]MCA3561353.1 DNA-3-methyladenine glycosylase 2 family protein [Aestuariivirga sp.]